MLLESFVRYFKHFRLRSFVDVWSILVKPVAHTNTLYNIKKQKLEGGLLFVHFGFAWGKTSLHCVYSFC